MSQWFEGNKIEMFFNSAGEPLFSLTGLPAAIVLAFILFGGWGVALYLAITR